MEKDLELGFDERGCGLGKGVGRWFSGCKMCVELGEYMEWLGDAREGYSDREGGATLVSLKNPLESLIREQALLSEFLEV